MKFFRVVFSWLAWVALLIAAAGCGCETGSEPDGGGLLEACVAATGERGTGGPLHFDVGAMAGGEGTDQDDRGDPEKGPAAMFVADGPYDPERGFGWIGEAVRDQTPEWLTQIFTIGTHSDVNPWSDPAGYNRAVEPYRTWVWGLEGYRVDVPDGVYRVTLMFLEPQFSEPGLRVLGVSAQGLKVLEGLDLAAAAGQSEIVELSVQVESKEGRILLEFESATGFPPLLAGLIVEPASPEVPLPPTGLEARSGAEEVLLRWDLPDTALRGWSVQRATDDGSFEPVTFRVAPFFIDRNRDQGATYVYRVAGVDASCRVGEAVQSAPVTVLEPADSGLPVLDIEVDPVKFVGLHEDPFADLRIEATVTSGKETAAGTLELRGQSTRALPKRSFNLRFDSGTIDGRDRLKLLAEQPDPTRLWQLLAYDLIARMGGVASRARPVLVRINREVYGVYDDIEHVGDGFLESRGYGVNDRFRIRTSNFSLLTDEDGQIDLSGFEKMENRSAPSPQLEALILWLNSAAEHEVNNDLDVQLDADVFTIYLAAQQLFSNYDIADGGHYLALDPGTDRFLLAPWDLNNETWTRGAHPLAYNTFYSAGPAANWWEHNWLWTRAVSAPDFRGALADRLRGALEKEFGDEMAVTVDRIHDAVAPALQMEPWVWRRRDENWIAAGPGQILEFIEQRREYLAGALCEFEQLGQTGLVICEVAPGAAGYFELENRSGEPFDARGCWLSDDPYQPAGMSLDPVGTVEANGRAVVFSGEVAPRLGGGFVLLSCEADEPEGEQEDDEEGQSPRRLSFAFYPSMETGSAYVRDGAYWSVASPSPGVK